MKTKATENTLQRWTRPICYMGSTWEDYFSSGVGQSRDSGPLERANFDAMLKAIGGEQTSELEDPDDPGSALSLVRVVRENHWAVGWVEWIAIHESATEQLLIASGIKNALENYPVIDDELYSQYESEEANEVWEKCYRTKERIEYIRAHRSQFEFRGLSDLIGCVRGHTSRVMRLNFLTKYTMKTIETKATERFFFEQAGWNYDPKKETSAQGRRRCAKQLAQAEAKASELGFTYEWEQDDTTNREWTDEGLEYYTWRVVQRDANGKINGALCGVDFGEDGTPWDQPYRRVVEAELALEAV